MRITKRASRWILLCVYLAASTIVGKQAEAAFHLDRVEPDWRPTGYAAIESDRWVNETPVARPVASRTVSRVAAPTRLPSAASGRCYARPGTPPQSVLDREIKGAGYSPTAYNFQGSGASGCWQFMPETWGGYKGYRNAADAPVEVQNERAEQVWNGGRGCGHWSSC